MSPELKGFIIGSTIPFIGIIANAIFQLMTSHQHLKTENAIKYRDSLFRLAYDYWKEESPRRNKPVPLEEYMIRMDNMHALFIEEKPSEEKVAAKLRAFKLLQAQWDKYNSAPPNLP